MRKTPRPYVDPKYKERLKFLSCPRKTETCLTAEFYSWGNAGQTHLLLSEPLTALSPGPSLFPQFHVRGHVRKPNGKASTEFLTVECLSEWAAAFREGNNRGRRTRLIFPTLCGVGISSHLTD